MKSVAIGIIKYILFIYNLFYLITGILMLTVGFGVKAAFLKYEQFLDASYFSATTLLISLGFIIFIISFFGCFGAIKENHCMVMTYSILLGIVFVIELTTGIIGYVLYDRTTAVLTATLNRSMYEYENNPEMALVWDELQENLQCCGTKGFKDWYPVFRNETLPMSCCHLETGSIGQFLCNSGSQSLFHTPCLNSLSSLIRDNAASIRTTGIAIALIQLVGLFFACKLARSIRLNYDKI